ncbi:hypothetical protein, partial [Streptomyces rhizosphaericus]
FKVKTTSECVFSILKSEGQRPAAEMPEIATVPPTVTATDLRTNSQNGGAPGVGGEGLHMAKNGAAQQPADPQTLLRG